MTFLTKLMQHRPLPVIVISSVAQSNCDIAVEAMRRGAVEVLTKPSGPYSVGDLSESLPQKIRAAFASRVRPVNGAPKEVPARSGRDRGSRIRRGNADRHRRVHRRHASHRGGIGPDAGALPADRDRAAHSGAVLRVLRQPSQFVVQDRSAGSARWRYSGARPGLGRSRQLSHDAAQDRWDLPRSGEGRAARALSTARSGRSVPVRGRRQLQRAWSA